jgi:hypothetical protein
MDDNQRRIRARPSVKSASPHLESKVFGERISKSFIRQKPQAHAHIHRLEEALDTLSPASFSPLVENQSFERVFCAFLLAPLQLRNQHPLTTRISVHMASVSPLYDSHSNSSSACLSTLCAHDHVSECLPGSSSTDSRTPAASPSISKPRIPSKRFKRTRTRRSSSSP